MPATPALVPATPRSVQTLAQTQPQQVLTVQIGSEAYGIEILRVQEIRHLEASTRIAGAPAHLLGVFDLRGFIVPIVDLRLALGLAAQANANPVLVVLSLGTRQVAVLVDAVSDVLNLRPEQIRPAPALPASGIDSRCISGLGVLEDGDARQLLILLDIEALLRDPSMGLFSAAITH